MNKTQVNAILESFKDDIEITDIIIVRQVIASTSKNNGYLCTHFNDMGQLHSYPPTQENHAGVICDSIEKELRG